MLEVGIDISNHTSDLIDSEILNQADLVVTLCSHADNNCPVLPKHVD
ncbi:arsenate reductase [Staphylococcus gallinarum]|uniref:Arsenate reductase n=1 Tax=Staphylococcus gallinarum TaxID=1293 RepID=A0A380FGR3_STAGA|nr:arsenate reductase [Staphylococcus gallinarum]